VLRGSELDHPSELALSPDFSTVAQAVNRRQLHKNDSRVTFAGSTRIIEIFPFRPDKMSLSQDDVYIKNIKTRPLRACHCDLTILLLNML
jgi:hypothetical protein